MRRKSYTFSPIGIAFLAKQTEHTTTSTPALPETKKIDLVSIYYIVTVGREPEVGPQLSLINYEKVLYLVSYFGGLEVT